jgi:hypothetical protein
MLDVVATAGQKKTILARGPRAPPTKKSPKNCDNIGWTVEGLKETLSRQKARQTVGGKPRSGSQTRSLVIYDRQKSTDKFASYKYIEERTLTSNSFSRSSILWLTNCHLLLSLCTVVVAVVNRFIAPLPVPKSNCSP